MKRIAYLIAVTLLAVSSIVNAGPVNTKGSKFAIHGYDPVAYFTESKPVKGSKQYAANYQGAKWVFSSAENKNLFEGNPEKYAPQYGGHCAFAAANKSIADIDPDAWHIYQDKLYLNYNKSVQKKWLPKKTALIPKADSFWLTLD